MRLLIIASVLVLTITVPLGAIDDKIADRLWESLPKDFIDQDELELLMRRDREMDEDPTKVISMDDLHEKIAERFPIVDDEV